MPEGATVITASAAFIAGLAGSVHCVAMCGGLAGALGMRTRTCNWQTTLRNASLHHAGRLGGYAAAGAAVGWLGITLQSLLNLPLLAVIARLAAAVVLMLIAARILFGWNALAPLERLSARFWRAVRPLAGKAASSGSGAGNLLLGLFWGWLPCGLVYSMLLFAALSGNALNGAAVMLMFGLGTLPAMLAATVLASRIPHSLRWSGTRQAVGVLLLMFGIWLGWAALASAHHFDHGQAAHVHLAHL
ncbi:MAG TPA: sulfite exporter TauE/SafE family protein [Steroidobacteraceae bacterium]|nr:sulfite exporter TauE/SafE family protein [Steroidobacteraceae bacterium]